MGLGLVVALYAFWTYRSYLGFAAADDVNANDIAVGAIRFDAWFSPPNYDNESRLDSPKWHSRLPFYAKTLEDDTVEVRGDSQEIVDREIQYASESGLDYWAFDYYGIYGKKPRKENSAFSGLHYGLRHYLSSDYKNELNFALNVTGEWIFNGNDDKNLSKWNKQFVPTVIQLMREPGYQTVLDDRPLIFIYKMDKAAEKMGGEEQLRIGIANLRKAALRNGLEDPYIVGLLWGYTHPAERVTKYGVDAVSAYTAHRGNPYDDGKLHPYSELMKSNTEFWDRLSAETTDVVPILNVGWDYRPNLGVGDQSTVDTYEGSPIYKHAKPEEIKNHLINAIKWIRNHPDKTKAKAILIYSWSEYPEGGVLAPTLDEGNARLRAISPVLNKASKNNSYKPVEPLYVGIKKLDTSLQIYWSDELAESKNFKTFWVAVRKKSSNEQVAGGSTKAKGSYDIPHSKLSDGEYVVRVQALYEDDADRIMQAINIKVDGDKIWVVD